VKLAERVEVSKTSSDQLNVATAASRSGAACRSFVHPGDALLAQPKHFMPTISGRTDPEACGPAEAERDAAKLLRRKVKGLVNVIGLYAAEFFPRAAREEIELNPKMVEQLSPKDLAAAKKRVQQLAESVPKYIREAWDLNFLFRGEFGIPGLRPLDAIGESGLPTAWEKDLRERLGYMADLFPGQSAARWAPHVDLSESPYLGPIDPPEQLLRASADLIAAYDAWFVAREALSDREIEIARAKALARWDSIIVTQ
jgi:hypothetical protein